MKIKGVIAEDFVNYKVPAMVIQFPYCDFKCEQECGEPVCHNGMLAHEPDVDIITYDLVEMYRSNMISEAIVMQGLEPFDSWEDLKFLVSMLRQYTKDDIVIYTGYYENEIADKLEELEKFANIVVKFGRYIPGDEPHFDKVLGVTLASGNQYARRIS